MHVGHFLELVSMSLVGAACIAVFLDITRDL